MGKGTIYIPPEIEKRVKEIQVAKDFERISEAARFLIRLGLLAYEKEEL